MQGIDRFRGCLLGGAAGDAMGYPVENMKREEIIEKYGNRGILRYELTDGKAEISDDTQLTLFTANALINAAVSEFIEGGSFDCIFHLKRAYSDWLKTQRCGSLSESSSFSTWITRNSELFNVRRPGRTCIESIETGAEGSLEKPINNSKGGGGVMRAAPIGLYCAADGFSREDSIIMAAKSAALTHGHELGYISAAMMVDLLWLIYNRTELSLAEAVASMKSEIYKLFRDFKHIDEIDEAVGLAMELADKDIEEYKAVAVIGEGWVAEEAIAIAIYSCLKHCDNFQEAVLTAVNHAGDSDSTGALAGSIMGCYLGYECIPVHMLERLELKELIEDIATDLYDIAVMSHEKWEIQKSRFKRYCIQR